MNARLLIVDRDARYREWLRHHLGVLCPEGTITTFDTQELDRSIGSVTRVDFDLLLLAAPFGESPGDPRSEGLERLRQLKSWPAMPAIIVIAEDGNELTAVRAIQLGAIDYLPKRLLTPERLRTAVQLALRRQELQEAGRETLRDSEPSPSAGAAAERTGEIESTADEEISADVDGAPGMESSAGDGSAGHDSARDAEGAATADRGTRAPIPGYTIRRTIGESEKAIVYLATSTALGMDVALKVSRSEIESASDRQIFAREYAALSALRHPAIVRIHEYGVHHGREYLAMEYFTRGDLKARLQRGILEPDVLRYVEQIARALDVVHTAGIFHRDLKPPNVMLRETDEIVLIDFGLARNMQGELASTRKGVLRGSPYYMSPEQALGEKLDARTDLYSLGIIFYEMLTGKKPYTGTTAIEVLQQHVNAPAPRLPAILEHLQSLLDGLTAKSPDERFASASQVVEAVSGMRELREPSGTVAA
ncbi:MAG TPA: protein kinase [Steroidobacteraceae bacterium]|nr:protein kinase [Steroidobacteraceae bacterium]